MFLILNRLRGTYGWFAKVNGVVLGLLTYLIFQDLYISTAVAVGYVLGECFGWGDWVGTLTSGVGKELLDYEEGKNNGIQWIASKIVKPIDWINHCRVALAIRGFYWWLPTLAPLMFVMSPLYVLTSILLLSIGFPIACELGRITANKFSFTFKNFSVVGGWEWQEVWYGLMQDLVLITLGVSLWIK